MKYRTFIPAPKAKRMVDNCKLRLILHNGWEGDTVQESQARPGDMTFDVPEGYEWIHATSVIDGESFSVEVEYQNKKGNRKQTIRLVPEKVK
jgi:hypothetical protein